jgi:hypothetical protein
VIGRASIWSDDEVQRLAARFVPAADEVWFLQHADTPEAAWFRRVADEGHYKGRGPDTTRQGIYAATPSGRLLASINHNDPRRVAAMLTQALARWEALPRAERLAAEAFAGAPWRWEDLYPADGLALRVVTRDLPRPGAPAPARPADWRPAAWNQDFAWFRRAEVDGFLPAPLEPGASRAVSDLITHRLARFGLVDIVRGQSEGYPADAVAHAALTSTVVAVRDGLVGLRLEGRVRLVQRGAWRIRGLDEGPASAQERGVDGAWLGRAVWDPAAARFAAFELVWLGSRWGATRYNCRADDCDAAPMGAAFTLAGDTPADRVAPAQLWSYGWPVRFPRAR